MIDQAPLTDEAAPPATAAITITDPDGTVTISGRADLVAAFLRVREQDNTSHQPRPWEGRYS